MKIRYITELDEIDWNDVSRIISMVGWGSRSPENLKAAFEKSSFVRFAYLDNDLIGMGRTVDDGAFYGWIVDLAVLPEYQGNGIGSRILKELEAELKPFITTMLTAAPGKGEFYKKQGWLRQSSAYIFPRSEWQLQAFAEES